MAVMVPVSAPFNPRFPRSLSEFNAWFPDDEACYAYLERLRWPDGSFCPRCSVIERMWHVSPRVLRCLDCRSEVSLTAGTIFERTHLPLKVWFQAAWLVTNEKLGISALGLKRSLEMNRLATAWYLLHKLRRAMVDPERELLFDEIEVDETYLDSVDEGTSVRKVLAKTIIAIAVELPEPLDNSEEQKEGAKHVLAGRIRLARIPDVTTESLVGFVSSNVFPGAVIYTDGWRSYRGLTKAGYIHSATNISQSGDPAHVHLPRVHRVASLLKRWILGTHQGGISQRQIDRYLEEFVFRFNRRRSESRGLLFYRLLQLAVKVDPVRASEIIASPSLPDEGDVPF